jgi:hypothetical protein
MARLANGIFEGHAGQQTVFFGWRGYQTGFSKVTPVNNRRFSDEPG